MAVAAVAVVAVVVVVALEGEAPTSDCVVVLDLAFSVSVVAFLPIASTSNVLSNSNAQCPRTTRKPTNCHSKALFLLGFLEGVVVGFVVEFAGDLRGRVERLGLKQPILVGLDLFGEEMLGDATGSPAGWIWLWFSAGERADKTQMPRRFGSVVSSTGLNWNDVDIFLWSSSVWFVLVVCVQDPGAARAGISFPQELF